MYNAINVEGYATKIPDLDFSSKDLVQDLITLFMSGGISSVYIENTPMGIMSKHKALLSSSPYNLIIADNFIFKEDHFKKVKVRHPLNQQKETFAYIHPSVYITDNIFEINTSSSKKDSNILYKVDSVSKVFITNDNVLLSDYMVYGKFCTFILELVPKKSYKPAIATHVQHVEVANIRYSIFPDDEPDVWSLIPTINPNGLPIRVDLDTLINVAESVPRALYPLEDKCVTNLSATSVVTLRERR